MYNHRHSKRGYPSVKHPVVFCLLWSILLIAACSDDGVDFGVGRDDDAVITEQLEDNTALRSASGLTDQRGELLIEDPQSQEQLIVQAVNGETSGPIEGATVHFATDGDAIVLAIADSQERYAPTVVSTTYQSLQSPPLAANLMTGNAAVGPILQPGPVRVLKIVLEAISAIQLGVDAVQLSLDLPILLSFTVLDSEWCVEPDQLANITGVYVGVVFLLIGGGIVVAASETVGSVLLDRAIIDSVKDPIAVKVRHFSFAPVGLALPVEVEGPCEKPDDPSGPSSGLAPPGPLCATDGDDLREGEVEQEGDLNHDGSSEQLAVRFSKSDGLVTFDVSAQEDFLFQDHVEAHDVGAVSGPIATLWQGDLTGDGLDEATLCVMYWGANDLFLSALVFSYTPQGGSTVLRVENVPNGNLTWSGSELVTEDLVNWLTPSGGVCVLRTKTFFVWNNESFTSTREETEEDYPEGAGCAPALPPSAPSGAGTAAGTLYWTDNSDNEDGFYIYSDSADYPECGFQQVGQVPANSREWQFEGVCLCPCGVSAFNTAGESEIAWWGY